jgi:hypothetical protein
MGGNFDKAHSYINYFIDELEPSIFQNIIFILKKTEFFELIESKVILTYIKPNVD